VSTPEQPTRAYISFDGQQINVETYNAYNAREKVQANELTAKDFERLRAVCVRTRAIDNATSLLRMHNAVALIGLPGCGRRTAGWAAWSRLGQPAGLAQVVVTQPSPIDVFRSHLEYECPGKGDPEAGRGEVAKVLDGASPADAVRLARLAVATMSSGSAIDSIAEAIDAYHNWEAELEAWFQTHPDGYQRALLIAAAVLNESDAAAVFKATDLLCGTVRLPRPEGGGLVGEGSSKLLEWIGAEPAEGGRIRLPRPAYPISVLDHVWRDRPQLRADLKTWLVDLPNAVDSAQARCVGTTIVELAVRQGDASLITNAVGTWAKPGETHRELATDTLARAAGSDNIGRSVRRTMYRWASTAGTELSLQLTIAEVCGGNFGRRFPSNALTRLRHLARNGGPEVSKQVSASLRSLAQALGTRDLVLRELVAWAMADGRERSTALSAFLSIAIDNAVDLVPPTTSDVDQIDLLAAGLHAALRQPTHVMQFRETCCAWLEAAAQGQLSVAVVTDTIARSCQDSYDIGVLATVVMRWGEVDGKQPTQSPREEIANVMLRKAADRDPLAPGVSTSGMYQATRETREASR
jgi:hypothetical protein